MRVRTVGYFGFLLERGRRAPPEPVPPELPTPRGRRWWRPCSPAIRRTRSGTVRRALERLGSYGRRSGAADAGGTEHVTARLAAQLARVGSWDESSRRLELDVDQMVPEAERRALDALPASVHLYGTRAGGLRGGAGDRRGCGCVSRKARHGGCKCAIAPARPTGPLHGAPGASARRCGPIRWRTCAPVSGLSRENGSASHGAAEAAVGGWSGWSASLEARPRVVTSARSAGLAYVVLSGTLTRNPRLCKDVCLREKRPPVSGPAGFAPSAGRDGNISEGVSSSTLWPDPVREPAGASYPRRARGRRAPSRRNLRERSSPPAAGREPEAGSLEPGEVVFLPGARGDSPTLAERERQPSSTRSR